MTVPALFVGAWERRSVALDGGPPVEPASVIWVQGRSAYADLRVPIDGTDGSDGVECFAGHTTWEQPHLHWSHDIDLSHGPAAATDIGTIEWVDGDMVETGTFAIDGRDVPYVEVWHRLAGSEGRVVETTDRGTTRVEVGVHELTVIDERDRGGAFVAEYRRAGTILLAYDTREAVVAW